MIKLHIPFMTPTDNHIYTGNGFGGRTLSAKAKSFKTRAIAHLVQEYQPELMQFRQNTPKLVLLRLYLAEIENKGWAKKATDQRYKKLDAGNRRKLVEDALVEASNVDDRETMVLITFKLEGLPERIDLLVWDMELEDTPFDQGLYL